MDTFTVTAGLTLDKHPRGAVVNYFAQSGDEADGFHVGLNRRSLEARQKTLSRNTASWETNDGSLRVIKREGQVTLVFKMQGPPHESSEVVLEGADLTKFEEAVAQLAPG
jgi:hypothetical protein